MRQASGVVDNAGSSSAYEEGFAPGFFTGLGDLVEGTLSALHGEEHRRHRKLLGMAYKPLNVHGVFACAEHVIEEHLASIAREKEVLLVEQMVKLTFDLHLRTLGLTERADEATWYFDTWAANPMALMSPRWMSFPGTPLHKAMRGSGRRSSGCSR